MIVVFSDTHATAAPALSEQEREAVAAADVVVHAGDFTGPESFDAFEERSTRLVAVHGNRDHDSLRDRLPSVETVEWKGWRIVLTHGHEHDRTSLPLLAREQEADLVIVGHTHRPGIEWVGDLPVVNPGSHARPRGGPETVATLSTAGDALVVEIRTLAGERIDRQRVGDGGTPK